MSTSTLKIHIPASAPGSRRSIRTQTRPRPATIPFPISDDSRLESLAFHNGRVYDSYLACESDRTRFWSSDRSGVLTYVEVSGHLKVGGGLLAKDEDKPRLLAEFLSFVRKHYRSAVFFNITDADLPLFQQHGIQATKWGEDAVLDLSSWNCHGKAFEWLRRQRNYCTRHNVQCVEWHPAHCSKEEYTVTRDELLFVADDSLKSKPQSGEMTFFEGRLDFNNLGNKRIFLARSGDGQGRIEAFVVANPYESGRGWAFEMYRHRQDAIRGAVPHLKLAIIDILKAEGVEQVSLCLVPGLNCGSKIDGDSGLVRRLMSFGTQFLNAIFDTAGVYHYKSRFRPGLESRYVCAFPRSSLGTVWTSAQLLGIWKLSPTKLISRWWNQLMNGNRASLARLQTLSE